MDPKKSDIVAVRTLYMKLNSQFVPKSYMPDKFVRNRVFGMLHYSLISIKLLSVLLIGHFLSYKHRSSYSHDSKLKYYFESPIMCMFY